jgi:peptidoglycan hydrolase-like protein with peptidoglycan-binding domain
MQQQQGNTSVQHLLHPPRKNGATPPSDTALVAPESMLESETARDFSQVAKLPLVTQTDQVIQRSDDLSSPRFASDSTLEDIFDGIGSLKKGDESDSVRKVQHGIHDSGILFLGHGVDGKFGRETKKHVTRFQRRHGISSDSLGEVGAATIKKLDELFPPTALPSTAADPYTFSEMRKLLCQWNSALVQDLKNLYVQMVGDLEWADEEFDGANWVPKPMPGAGETSGFSIIIATNGKTNEEVATTLYHEYQHARVPVMFRSGDWGEEETRVYEMETHWAIDRGLTPDPDLTTTDPITGEVEVDPTGIESTVESYPGLDDANPGEVISKVGTNRVRVRLPDGRVTIRNAVVGDSIPGPRRITPPRHFIRDSECHC